MIRLIAASTLAFASPALAAAPTWAQINTDSGWVHDSVMNGETAKIDVATRTISGTPCFRASTKVAAHPDKLLEAAADIDGSKRWSSAGLAEAKLLSKSSTNLDYYQVLDVPGWTMASDRFWFLHGTVERPAGSIVFRWERLDQGGAFRSQWQDVKARYSSAVEPPVNVGAWVFTGTGTVDIKYYICTDSGGSIPQTLQTAATRRTLPATVDDLVKEARKRTK